MVLYLFLLLLSFIVHSILFIPYINLLYNFKFQRQKQKTKDALGNRTPIFDSFHKNKSGTPVGGGLLIILITVFLFILTFIGLKFMWYPITSIYTSIGEEIKIVLFVFCAFSLVGIYDDVKKTFITKKETFFGLRLRHKLILETIVSFIAAYWLYYYLHIDIINIPLIGVFHLGFWYIPFAAFVILAFANALNITDGLDGLATGLFLISLFALWVVSASIFDTTLSVFTSILIGGLIAFLYYNVYPARIFLGDVGALSFGATFAVIGLLLGKPFGLIIMGGIFVFEAFTSLSQLSWKRIFHKKLFPVSPFHLYLQFKGWPEPKITMRLWLIGLVLGIVGLMLSFI